jgi:hypothetical protein
MCAWTCRRLRQGRPDRSTLFIESHDGRASPIKALMERGFHRPGDVEKSARIPRRPTRPLMATAAGRWWPCATWLYGLPTASYLLNHLIRRNQSLLETKVTRQVSRDQCFLALSTTV